MYTLFIEELKLTILKYKKHTTKETRISKELLTVKNILF